MKGNAISDNMLAVLIHNVWSVLKYVDDVVSDNRIINNGTKHKSICPILLAK